MLVCRFLALSMILLCGVPVLSGCGGSSDVGVATGKDVEPPPQTQEEINLEKKAEKQQFGQ
jgi:hypothetical protein